MSPPPASQMLAPRPVPMPAPNDTSFKWIRDLFDLFGKGRDLDKAVGQDALYVAVKMSEGDRAVLLRVLKELKG